MLAFPFIAEATFNSTDIQVQTRFDNPSDYVTERDDDVDHTECKGYFSLIARCCDPADPYRAHGVQP